MQKHVEERRVPFQVYVTPTRMKLAREGGLQNFSGTVNKMLDTYVEKAKLKPLNEPLTEYSVHMGSSTSSGVK
jgi:hypothetical protein